MSTNNEWTLYECCNKKFWHIADDDNILDICKKGLKQSSDGQIGRGIYCLEAEDYEVLDSVLELMEQREGCENLLSIVEFKHSGKYLMVPKDELIYSNEGWCCVQLDINPYDIERIMSIKDI